MFAHSVCLSCLHLHSLLDDDKSFCNCVTCSSLFSLINRRRRAYDCYHLPAFQLLLAELAAVRLLKMTRLALELLPTTGTPLLNQEGALGTLHFVRVAVVLDRRMAACWNPMTVESTFRQKSTARLWWLQGGSPAVTAYVVEYCLWAASTRTAMTYLLASMATTLEQSPACLDAYVLGFDRGHLSCYPVLPLGCLPLHRLFFPRAAALSTLVSPAAQGGLANSHAQRTFKVSLMTRRFRSSSTTSARQTYDLLARPAFSAVAFLRTVMSAREHLVAGTLALRYRVFAEFSRFVKQLP